MEAFSPELAHHWLAGHVCAADDGASARCDEAELSPAQQVALEELTERVNAARSVY